MYDLILSIYSIIQAIKGLASIIIFIMNTKENLFFCCFTAKMLIISLQFDLYAETSLPKKVFFLWQRYKTTRRCSAKGGEKKAETTHLDWGGLLVKLNLTI